MPLPPKVSPELLDLLNQAIARELQVSIQYMWQHVLMTGIEGNAFKDELKKIAIVEMQHAEDIAERLVYLGGTPTSKPTTITLGESFREMIEQDTREEAGAIELYRRILTKAAEEKDVTTKFLFERIVAEEEEHHDFFSSLLEQS